MTHFMKLISASAIALTLAACETTTTDGSMQVGVGDNDQYTSTQQGSDIQLSDAQKFGVNDDDGFDATAGMTAPMVGGAAMYPNKTIVENASAAGNLTTLVSLVSQAGLVETLSSKGPFTVFAPTNTAFSMLPAATTDMLTKPENKDALANVLKAHVISGTVTSSDLMAQLTNGRSYTATTVSGDELTFYKMGDGIRVADENGTLARIENADVMQSNGVVHVVSSVLVPK